MRNIWKFMALAAVIAALIVPGTASAGKPTIMKGCKACHKAEDNVVRGRLVSSSDKFKSIQVDAGVVWIIRYDEKTELVRAGSVGEIKKKKEITVHWTGTPEEPVATKIVVKPVMEVPEEQLISAEELKELVAMGPKKGNFMIIDSRPGKAFNGGHLPYAKSIPFKVLKEKEAAVLPEDKGTTLIFYCGGFT